MDTRYPVRRADGKDFSREEMQILLRALRQEKPGRWLAGANNMWHGGMHFGGEDVPWSVLTPDGGEGPVPLQCIADGELVAWRVCQDFMIGDFGERSLQYSPSFLLVRSVHKPTQDASTWLCFYTLYMHLAPLSCYPKWPVYQVTPQGNGLIMRRHSGSEVPGQAAPPEIAHGDRLHSGEQVLVARQETFLMPGGQEEVFGLAQRLKDGVPVGDKFWTSVRPAFVEPVGEQYGHLPGWMSVALKAGQFDRVVCPSVMTRIRAGDAVGFLGKNDAADGFRNIMEEWFAHIEVMSNDGRMPLFLDNPGKLNTGRQYRTVPEGKALYRREDTERGPHFTEESRTNAADAAEIIQQASATTATDSTGAVYLRLRSGQWIRQDETEVVSQHDLTKLKFHAVTQPPVHNLAVSLEEPWAKDTFRWLAQQMRDGRDREAVRLQDFCVRMADEMESGLRGSPEHNRGAIANVLTHWNADIDFFLRRLVVKHESEWYGDSRHPKWADVLAPLSGDFLTCVKQWLDLHEWMSQVPEFSRDEAIWHFHPVEFMEAISVKNVGRITLPMLRMIWTSTANVSNELLQQVADELNAGLDLCNLNTEGRLYHFMAQVYQETGAKFSIVENLNYTSTALPIFFSYYRHHPAEQELDGRTVSHSANQVNIANKAYGDKNGNNMPGDGWLYRGRGMKQLTGKSNYRRFSAYNNSKWGESADFVSSPDLVADEIKYAVRSALFFWDDNKMYLKADDGYSLEASIQVTNIINSGLTMDEKKIRFNNLESLLNKKVFQGVFD